ncbi:bacillithiol biosynthesis cysteine-adding enzyme BshC [Fodinibius salsisoli]|uniref:Putative cysteine ligase BshC n=1 Tax=Fodinibius salsisoli TaxID=2820877 RepID=A0ABT3PLM1_9BACT|nr:bacillithiol biosynthesis cysteine-adding enzyme BshC [Fodinibius salsisoli]MCW9706797.1 bacillithiol biosynthesis cysteine-adding enzyme BshC [Fodinibius salsisoli]
MHRKNTSFQNLPFSKLFKTYTSDFSKVDPFYSTNPFDKEAVLEKANQLHLSGDRSRTVEILKEFNEPFDVHEQALQNMDRLQEEETLAIVTGQQLGLYGGPLFTVLKTISAIHLSRQMEELLERPVVPIFWLADEDHDYDEVRSIHLLNRQDELQDFELPKRTSPLPPVADLSLPPELKLLRKEVRNVLYETDFSADLWELLDQHFSPGNTFLEAFGGFINHLFSKHGLILAGSNHPDVKAHTKEILKYSVNEAEAIKEALEEQSEKISEQFHQQVTLYDSNLFFLSEEGNRLKINVQEDHWTTEEGHKWTTEELLQKIDEMPEQFSPNVFLRPLLQDEFLPTLGYVAGPGELAYYGQMKELYACFDHEMPVIFPRLSAAIIEPSIERIIDKLPFGYEAYSQRIEDLESAYVEQSDQVDIEAIFDGWKQKVEQAIAPEKEKVAAVDPTLDGAAGKATAVYFGELDKLKGKVYRAAKQQDQTQLNRIRKIKKNIFPDGSLQERSISVIYFMNKFGVEIWDELLASLEEGEIFDQHKLFYLQS